jgi:hypothetical protein
MPSSRSGRVILSGGQDGVIVVSSATTAMTLRVLLDHKNDGILSLAESPLNVRITLFLRHCRCFETLSLFCQFD